MYDIKFKTAIIYLIHSVVHFTLHLLFVLLGNTDHLEVYDHLQYITNYVNFIR